MVVRTTTNFAQCTVQLWLQLNWQATSCHNVALRIPTRAQSPANRLPSRCFWPPVGTHMTSPPFVSITGIYNIHFNISGAPHSQPARLRLQPLDILCVLLCQIVYEKLRMTTPLLAHKSIRLGRGFGPAARRWLRSVITM